MAESQTSTRADAAKAAGNLARSAIENLVKDAVAEAMREFEEDRGSASSNRRRIPAAVLLLAIGALIGFALATRREGETFGPEMGVGRQAEAEPGGGTTTEMESTDESEPAETTADEDEVDATATD